MTDLVLAGPLVPFTDVPKVTSRPIQGFFLLYYVRDGEGQARCTELGTSGKRLHSLGATELGKGSRLPKSEARETSLKTVGGREKDSGGRLGPPAGNRAPAVKLAARGGGQQPAGL